MKAGGLKLMAQAAVLAIFMPAAAHAGDVNAKLELCQSCHNLSFQGYSGYLIMPRLAGQTPEYITNQLQAFAERRRERGIFFNMARTHRVPAGMQEALARRFKNMPGKAIGGGPKHLVDTGKRIYLDGVAGEDVPACASCHGQEAEGKDVSARFGRPIVPLPCQGTDTLERCARPRDGTRRPKEESAFVEPIGNRSSLGLCLISAIGVAAENS